MVGSIPFFSNLGFSGGGIPGPDTSKPVVTTFSPADNATGVAINATLRATFNETVVLGAAGTINLKKTSDNSLIESWDVATEGGSGAGQVEVVGGNVLTMHLTSSLTNAIEYYVVWDAGVVEDLAGNGVAALSSTTTWSFTTILVAPTVVSFSPLDNATDVAVDATLAVTVSQTVTLGASGTISLKLTSDDSTVEAWDVATDGGSGPGKVEVLGGTALTMHLASDLSNSVEYYVVWGAGVVKNADSVGIAAQSSTTAWSFTTVAGGASYLLDVLGVSAARAYSTRKLRSAYAGSAIRIRRSSDNAEQDIGFSGEDLDTAAITTFVGSNSAYVAKWYDQSGTGDDAVQATAALQPRIVNAGALDVRNTKAAPKFDGTDDIIASGSSTNVQEIGILVATTEVLVWSNYLGAISDVTGNNDKIGLTGSAGLAEYYTVGSVLDTISVNSGGNVTVFSSVLQQVDALGGSAATYSAVQLGEDRDKGRYWPGWIGEAVVFATALSGGNRTAMYTNQAAYWGTPTLLLDVLGVSATRAYSTRKLRAAYAGSAIRIRRSSDNAEQDIGFVGENLDTAAITTFVGSNSAFVVKWYDQSGTGDDAVQATAASQPRIVNAGTLDVKNTKAAPAFDGTDDALNSTIGLGFYQMAGIVAATTVTPIFTSYVSVASTQTTDHILTADGASTSAFYNSAGALKTISVNSGGNAASMGGPLMQVTASDVPALDAGSEWVRIGNDVGIAGRYWPGWIGEVVIFAASLSAPNITVMYTNQKTYWGTP